MKGKLLFFMTWPMGNKLLVVLGGKVLLLAMVLEEKEELLVGWVMEERLLLEETKVFTSKGISGKLGWGPTKSLTNFFLILISTENGVSATT